MILIIKRFLTALPVSLLLSTGSYAACERIDQPSSHPALEQAKAHLSIGQIEAAVAQLDMPDSVRPQLIQEFSKALSAGVVECITARRVRQAERFMGELIVFVTENGFLYVSIEGVVNEGSFRFANLFWTTDFSEVQSVFY